MHLLYLTDYEDTKATFTTHKSIEIDNVMTKNKVKKEILKTFNRKKDRVTWTPTKAC